MAYTCAWLQHQACNAADRNYGPNATLVDDNKAPIDHVELSALEKQDR
jgi:hypothetical protein